MTEARLNDYLILLIHKELTDSLSVAMVAKEFVNNDERSKFF